VRQFDSYTGLWDFAQEVLLALNSIRKVLGDLLDICEPAVKEWNAFGALTRWTADMLRTSERSLNQELVHLYDLLAADQGRCPASSDKPLPDTDDLTKALRVIGDTVGHFATEAGLDRLGGEEGWGNVRTLLAEKQQDLVVRIDALEKQPEVQVHIRQRAMENLRQPAPETAVVEDETVQFIPTPLQETVLDTLNGKAMKKEALAETLKIDSSRLYRQGGIKELMDLKMVDNLRGIGYYRPDAPPPNALELRLQPNSHQCETKTPPGKPTSP
jgi:hypothetical protein